MLDVRKSYQSCIQILTKLSSGHKYNPYYSLLKMRFNFSSLVFDPRLFDADLYFKFGAQAQDRTLDELGFIRTTIGRVRTVLSSRSPFGAAIFDIDPLRDHPEYMAYSPMQLGDPKRNNGTTSLRIYLCDGIDARPQDHFAHILTHELFHFVDDEAKETWIVDAPHGYRDGAMRLSHQQRMHNADNYALFVTHTEIGRARLIASQPMLAPCVPADMP